MSCAFVSDRRYGWAAACEEVFGQVPVQVCPDWLTTDHVAEYEGRPGRRALTYDELQTLFDAADDLVEVKRKRRRKGLPAAWRDAAMIKQVYAYGTRRRETSTLDLPDLRHNPRAKQYRQVGALKVQFGKAPRGSPPKRRTVLTVPEVDWIVPVLEEWVDKVRAGFSPGGQPALWVTERRARLGLRRLDEVFAAIRGHAGLPEELELHCLRHIVSASFSCGDWHQLV
ncbi:tyrosine-type recombinase/integrase [Streptomyces sp. GbtcB6]|uniref:tyrosine-type recombinase/integrase n=1 Tax=Streptomyces sp. GbtcB6 TaxID=2824751 RepID=UPI0020C71CAD|nr:tyrosine-type recombinase/integrase [Streptomyces sp. GbtcB6]